MSPRPPRAAPDEDVVRLTTVIGTLAAAALLVAFFLPWVVVEEGFARRYADRVAEEVDREVGVLVARGEDWRRLAEGLAARGNATGLDAFHWARTAYAESAGGDARRALLVLAVALALLPVTSIVLLAYFVAHRFRRARSPALILAMLLGFGAVAITATYGIFSGAIDAETDPAPGLSVLVGAGFAMVLVGAFGVRARNWWRVFGGTAIVATALVVLAWVWLRWGRIP